MYHGTDPAAAETTGRSHSSSRGGNSRVVVMSSVRWRVKEGEQMMEGGVFFCASLLGLGRTAAPDADACRLTAHFCPYHADHLSGDIKQSIPYA